VTFVWFIFGLFRVVLYGCVSHYPAKAQSISTKHECGGYYLVAAGAPSPHKKIWGQPRKHCRAIAPNILLIRNADESAPHFVELCCLIFE
jgi:hypothetical protein